MTLTTTDIENLDKIVYGLTQLGCDTVPEILDGWQKFPFHDDPRDTTYRFYENFLVDNKICAIKSGWTPNSVISGFKTLQLDSEGYKIIHHKISVEDFIRDKEQNRIQPAIQIIGDKNIVGNSNFTADKIHRSELDFSNHLPTTDPNQKANTSNQYSFWTKTFKWITNHIVKILLALITAFLIFKLGWN